jgi:hypothetical protein
MGFCHLPITCGRVKTKLEINPGIQRKPAIPMVILIKTVTTASQILSFVSEITPIVNRITGYKVPNIQDKVIPIFGMGRTNETIR